MVNFGVTNDATQSRRGNSESVERRLYAFVVNRREKAWASHAERDSATAADESVDFHHSFCFTLVVSSTLVIYHRFVLFDDTSPLVNDE